jgi:hypothetical protein
MPNNSNINTMLHALAARVPTGGPCIRPFLMIPDNAPSWNGKVKVILKQEGWKYHQATTVLIKVCQEGIVTIIFCDGIISNKDQADGKQLGVTAMVLYQNGREQGHMEQVLGETVMEHDTMLCTLHPCLDTLTDTLTLQNPQEHINIVIATPLSYVVR